MKKTTYNTRPVIRKNTTSSEEELSRRLMVTLVLIIGFIAISVVSLTSFAPEIGSFFGLFSKYRGETSEEEKIKPNPPILSFLPNATKNEEINITGYSQPGLTVKLYVNGPEKDSTTTGADGLFVFNSVKLNSGTNTIFAKVFDAYGIESDSSSIYQVMVDKNKPELKVESPKNNETVKNLDGRIKIKGTINEKGTIKVNDKTAIVKPDLSFEFLLGVSEGDVSIKIEALDEAGNSTEEKLNIKYVKSSN